MEIDWRAFLYYPLGILPAVFFTLRIVVQWLQSEYHQRSYSGSTFWRLSIAGNILLLLHYCVQVQFPFALLQAGNAVIAGRNLQLIKGKNVWKTSTVIFVLLGVLATVTGVFLLQSYLCFEALDWIRTPKKLFDTERQSHSFGWHLMGMFGATVFASRFWWQWWCVERHQLSTLGRGFWWLSIVGSVLSLFYFTVIRDVVSAFHYGFALFPYIRNIMLIRRVKAEL